MERQLAEKERLALLGEMAAILAHEIRNPIGSIKGFAQFLLEREGKDQEEREFLQTMVEECVRLEKLVQDLLHYAREEHLSLTTFSLGDLVEECLKVLDTREGVEIKVQIPPTLTLKSDRDKMKQILLNLLENSLEAMGHGTITVRAWEKGEKVILEIQDQGSGMTREVQERIFQPFFTTKSQGTGLGMAIVKKLTDQLAGKVEVKSTPGKGTTFTITLPRDMGQQDKK